MQTHYYIEHFVDYLNFDLSFSSCNWKKNLLILSTNVMHVIDNWFILLFIKNYFNEMWVFCKKT